jgi:4-amino-4-deoxy-L-arabinose transferase-like glycosyltransferase
MLRRVDLSGGTRPYGCILGAPPMTTLERPISEAPSTGMGLAPKPAFAVGLVLLQAGIKLGLHLIVNATTPYGIHRDELLYLAMGSHLRLWRMDFPPAIAIVAEVSRTLLGESLVGLRLLPAVFGAAIVVLAAAIARELGGGKIAQGLAAFCVLTSPLFLRAANLLQPVVMDQLIWTALLYTLVRIYRGHGPGEWVLLGVLTGLGLLTKFSIAFIAVGILAAVLLTPLREARYTPWPWIALAAALLIGSPSLVGQLRLGFPVLGQMADLRASQLERVGALDFLLGQLLWGPAVFLAIAGAWGLLRSPAMRAFRPVGWCCGVVFLLLLLGQGKAYYAGPLYPTLFAAGTVLVERVSKGLTGEITQAATVAVLFAFFLIVAPLGVPILPPLEMAAYARALGVTAAVRTNTGEVGALPQDYADMLGWSEQAAAVARVYHELPPERRERAALVAGNYGEAGALDFYGPRHGLPPAVSPVGSYWYFGPGDRPGEVVITLGVPADSLRQFYDSVRTVAWVGHPWAVEEERRVSINVGTGARTTLQALWPSFEGRN